MFFWTNLLILKTTITTTIIIITIGQTANSERVYQCTATLGQTKASDWLTSIVQISCYIQLQLSKYDGLCLFWILRPGSILVVKLLQVFFVWHVSYSLVLLQLQKHFTNSKSIGTQNQILRIIFIKLIKYRGGQNTLPKSFLRLSE